MHKTSASYRGSADKSLCGKEKKNWSNLQVGSTMPFLLALAAPRRKFKMQTWIAWIHQISKHKSAPATTASRFWFRVFFREIIEPHCERMKKIAPLTHNRTLSRTRLDHRREEKRVKCIMQSLVVWEAEKFVGFEYFKPISEDDP